MQNVFQTHSSVSALKKQTISYFFWKQNFIKFVWNQAYLAPFHSFLRKALFKMSNFIMKNFFISQWPRMPILPFSWNILFVVFHDNLIRIYSYLIWKPKNIYLSTSNLMDYYSLMISICKLFILPNLWLMSTEISNLLTIPQDLLHNLCSIITILV